MNRPRTWLWILAAATLHASPAVAQNSTESLRLGSTEHKFERAKRKDGQQLLLAGGLTLLSAPDLPSGPLSVESSTLLDGTPLAAVTLGQGQTRHVAVVAARARTLKVLWSGSLARHGDLGEQRGLELRLDQASTEGPGPVVGESYDRVRLCGNSARPLLLRKALTFGGPVDVSTERAAEGQPLAMSVQRVDASTVSPPALPLLSPRSASSLSGALALDPPYAASDRDPISSFPVSGRGEFLTFGWAGGPFGLASIDLTFAGAAPRRLRIHVDGAFSDVELPAAPPGTRFRLSPVEPARTGCISVQLLASEGAVQVAEVAAYSSLEAAGGVQALVHALAGPHASDAERILNQSGPLALQAIVGSWDALPEEAQRRAVGLLGRYLSEPAVEAAMESALRSPSSAVAEAATATLLESQLPQAWSLVAARIASARPDGALAQQAARSGRMALVPSLLEGLRLAERPEDQAMLQQAFGTLIRRLDDDPAVAAPIRDFDRSTPPPAARARVAIELAKAERLPELATELSLGALQALATDATFEVRWWVIAALRGVASEPVGDAYLTNAARSSTEWMIRAAALDALIARQSPAATPAAQAALADSYPRLRTRAMQFLAQDPAQLERLLPHLTHDRWHLVRAVAAESLPDRPAVRAGLVTLIDDRVDVVQAAAISRASQLELAEAWEKVGARLADEFESQMVRLAAIGYARTQCARSASPVLTDLAHLGLQPNASESARELAVASVEALAALGGGAELAPLAQRVVDPGMRKAVQEALLAPATCQRVGTRVQL